MIFWLFLLLHFVVGLLGVELLLAVSLLRKVVALIGLFLSVALVLFVMQMEFLSLVVIIVYVGAIAVLFLFVVMLYSAQGLVVVRDVFLGLLVGILIVFVLCLLCLLDWGLVEFAGPDVVFISTEQPVFMEVVISSVVFNTFLANLGNTLWTEYLIAVLLTTILLLIGILGSVVLTRGMLVAKLRKRILLEYKGALTNKPHQFRFRAWELTSLKTYDLFDTSLSAVLVEVRGLEIMRIVPAEIRLPAFPWISDKTRFFFDGLNYQRVSKPLMSTIEVNCWLGLTWLRALSLGGVIVQRFMLGQFRLLEQSSLGRVRVGFTPFSDLREKCSVKEWGGKLGGVQFLDSSAVGELSNFSSFLDLGSIVDSVKTSKGLSIVLLVGVDLRFELPRLHLIYRHLIRRGLLRVYGVGVRSLGLAKSNVRQFGINSNTIIEVLEGRHQWLNVIRKLRYNDLVVLWGRGYRGWLSKNRGVIRLVNAWAFSYKAKLICLYSDVTTFGNWFVGGGSCTSNRFEKPLEGFDLVVNKRKCVLFSQGFAYESELLGDMVFASFSEELPLERRGLVFSVPTLLEQESLVIGLEGFTKKTAVVSALSGGSLSSNQSTVRTVRRILALLGKYGFGLRAGNSRLMQVLERGGVGVQYGNWSVNNGLFSSGIGLCSMVGGVRVVRFIALWRVRNFFQTDPVTRNSKLLGLAAQQFYANLSW